MTLVVGVSKDEEGAAPAEMLHEKGTDAGALGPGPCHRGRISVREKVRQHPQIPLERGRAPVPLQQPKCLLPPFPCGHLMRS